MSKPTNPNARRQYHVSTNMNEQAQGEQMQGLLEVTETDTIKTKIETTISNISAQLANPAADDEQAAAAKPAKKPHKRGSHSNATTTTDKASDDYCLERFKKNMRFSRSSKIKIAWGAASLQLVYLYIIVLKSLKFRLLIAVECTKLFLF